MDDNEVMDTKKKRKKPGFWKTCLIIVVVLAAILIPLILTNPSREELSSSVPTELRDVEGRKEREVYKNYYFISTYTYTKQISTQQAEKAGSLGIAGQVIPADSGLTEFISNTLIWMPSLLKGAQLTILLTVCSVIVGVILSIFLALGKISHIPIINPFCRAYIFFFRGTPLLMQLFFIYYGLPLINPAFSINSRFVAAWVAFSLNTGAYCAEVIRAGIQSIDKGQFEAAKALGFNYTTTMRKIIIPQTYRRLIPPVANEFIMVLKDASLTSIIALQDLSKVTQSIMTSTNDVMVYFPSMAIYLIITAIFTKIFGLLEKKFSIYE